MADDHDKPAGPPPRKAPRRVQTALFNADDGVELQVDVSDLVGIRDYGFAYDGAPVPMSPARGKFFATRGRVKLLEWVMIGEPGGHMKVVVTDNGTVIEQRDESTIPPPYGEGYDRFRLLVP